jgi:hypothetical protein
MREWDVSQAFHFWGCSEIRESVGMRADSERHLMERLEQAPADSIYYHSVRALMRRQVLPTLFPDDFARWVAMEVQDLALAERLALPSPFDFPTLEAFREHLLEVLDDHLSRMHFDPRPMLGRPFYFLRGHLTEFRAALDEVDDSSVYYHVVEAIGRLERPRNDFAAWVDEALGLPLLAARLAQIDPFAVSLGGVRAQVAEAVEAELAR